MTTELDAAAAAAPAATAAPEAAPAAPVEPAGTANSDLIGGVDRAPTDPMHIPHAVPQAEVHHATDAQTHHNTHPNTPPVSAPPAAATKDDSPLKTISRVQPSHADPIPAKKKYAWQKHKAARKA